MINANMRSSSHVLQGPRPAPLTISRSSMKMAKKQPQAPRPVVVYLRSPKIIHVRPEEFMSLVQQLTGNRSSTTTKTSTINNIVEDQNKPFCGEESSRSISSLVLDEGEYSGYCLDIHMIS